MRWMTVLVALAGCGPMGAVEGHPPLTQWLGAAPHFAVQGRVNGEDIDLRLDDAVAADIGQLFCTREYDVPVDATGALLMEQGWLDEVKVNAPFIVNNQVRVLELELKKHDFQRDDAGARIDIVARDDAVTPADHEMWFEWEWRVAASDDKVFEAAADSGAFTLEHWSGTPDGLMIPSGQGAIGAFSDARFGGDTLRVSFFAPCAESTVDDVE